MKSLSILVLLLAATLFSAQAQIINPVKWTFSSKKVKGDIYEVHMTANIQRGWSIYSQTTPDGGPVPTTIQFNKNPEVLVGGKVKEVGALKKKHEKVFGVDVLYFTEKVDFVQLVKRKNNKVTKLSGMVEFMACDEQQCLPPAEVAFAVNLQ